MTKKTTTRKKTVKSETTTSDLAATVTAMTLRDRSFIAITLLATKSVPGKSTLSVDHPDCIGQVLHGLKQLGVSKEALELLGKVGKSRDDIGEIDCFRSDDGKLNFDWLGGGKKLVEIAPGNDLGSRSYTAPKEADVTIIPNDFPEEARKVVETIVSSP